MAALPCAEQHAFLTAHPDLYVESNGAVRLRITAGHVKIGSLGGVPLDVETQNGAFFRRDVQPHRMFWS